MTTGIGYGLPWRINGPLPQAPTYTLLGAGRVVDDLDGDVERWMNGVEVYSYPADVANVFDPCARGSNGVEKVEGGAIALPKFGAMVVYLTETCRTERVWGGSGTDDQKVAAFKQRALAVFGAVEAAAVEREFLAGDVLFENPHLADGNGTFPNGDAATGVVDALAMLEAAIAESGRAGMIHVSPQVATVAAAGHMLDRDDRAGVLRTINGTVVVPGYGYVDETVAPSPSDAHPGGHGTPGAKQQWAYATGPVEVRRTETFVKPEQLWMALDRENNLVSYYAERYYLIDWDTTVQAAVLVDRCSTDCGSPA